MKGEYRSVYALGRQPTSDPGVQIQEGHQHFADNVVITSKVGFQNYFDIIMFVYLQSPRDNSEVPKAERKMGAPCEQSEQKVFWI